ncbi:MAG: hypothetical protein JWM91_3688 [Rhodospirillales bacterium]|nr:hypothetical protein [Rhodospirillales bacterium]
MVEPLRMETAGETLRSARLRALLRYWNEKRQDRPMPARGQIDPIEIPRLLPVALMAEMTTAGPRIRLLGSETTNAYGHEMRGQLIHEIEFGEFTPFWREAFALVVQSAAPTLAAGTFRKATELCSVEIALMPLADEDRSLSYIFGGVSIRPLARGIARPNGTSIFTSRTADDLDFRRAGIRSI